MVTSRLLHELLRVIPSVISDGLIEAVIWKRAAGLFARHRSEPVDADLPQPAAAGFGDTTWYQ